MNWQNSSNKKITSKRKISFVNPNFQQGPKEYNAYYLPYSPAVLWSFVNQFELIKNSFELDHFIWRRDPIEQVVEKLKDNTIVGFSTYVWNRNYNFVLARELKKVNPEILIIGGGPEYPIENKDFFKKFPFIDVCVKLEGEITFKKILEAIIADHGDFKAIPGILINQDGSTIDTGNAPRIEDLDSIPSPYLDGVFDTLIDSFPEIRWNATLETNRGCPYACTFCDWGSLTYNKIKKFSLSRVFEELEWIGKHRCDFVSITDANFGIFPERDNLIADKLIEVQKKYGYPKAYTIAWAKNQKREVVEIVKKLIYQGGAKIGLNLSVQSMDENVLEIIKRKNLEINKIKEIFSLCEENNIPLYTELILGLPGETLSTWKENFYTLFEAGNHTGITVYQAQLLENAEMNLLQKKLYKIKSRTVYDYLVGTYNEHEVKEGIDVIIETKDMPYEDMIKAQVFSWFINTFHINGLTNFASRFYRKSLNISYEKFYSDLFSYIKEDIWFSREIDRIEKHYRNWNTNGKIDHEPIRNIEIHGWNLIHSTMINFHSQRKYDHVFSVIENFLKLYDIDQTILDDLLNLQRNFIINYDEIKNYPKRINMKYDILGFIQNSDPIENHTVIEFDFPEDKDMNLQRFCEQIFFARRRNFGKSWITKK